LQKIHSIQFLRALAALSVVFFHVIGEAFTIGAAGVDVFFVISGFVMGAFAINATPGQFLYHRVLRIVPLYWAVTVVMCLGAMAGVFSSFSFTVDQLWKSLLFVPYANETGMLAPLVMVGWTLNVEMFFYLVFAVGLALRAPIAVTAGFLFAMAIGGHIIDWQSPVMQVWTSALLIEFLSGLFLSQLILKWKQGGLIAIGLSFVGFAIAAATGEQTGLLRLLSWGLPSLLLVAGCVWLETAGAWPKRLLRPFEIVGDASYALYLTHGLVISVVHKVLGTGFLSGIAVLMTAIGASIIIHLMFEKPVIRFLKKVWSSNSRAVVTAS
jgi:exopolysaccharide production protein ExoZ